MRGFVAVARMAGLLYCPCLRAFTFSGGADALQCCTAVPMVAAASAGNSTSVGELVSSTMYLLLSVTFFYFLLLSVTFSYFLLLSVAFCYFLLLSLTFCCFLLLSVTFCYFLAILFCLVNMCFLVFTCYIGHFILSCFVYKSCRS